MSIFWLPFLGRICEQPLGVLLGPLLERAIVLNLTHHYCADSEAAHAAPVIGARIPLLHDDQAVEFPRPHFASADWASPNNQIAILFTVHLVNVHLNAPSRSLSLLY